VETVFSLRETNDAAKALVANGGVVSFRLIGGIELQHGGVVECGVNGIFRGRYRRTEAH
jgi:hypothetical protein